MYSGQDLANVISWLPAVQENTRDNICGGKAYGKSPTLRPSYSPLVTSRKRIARSPELMIPFDLLQFNLPTSYGREKDKVPR